MGNLMCLISTFAFLCRVWIILLHFLCQSSCSNSVGWKHFFYEMNYIDVYSTTMKVKWYIVGINRGQSLKMNITD